MANQMASEPVCEWRRDGYIISTDPARLDVELLHRILSDEAPWVAGIPREGIAVATEHSLMFGLYTEQGRLIGFARVVTDYATIAWIPDVVVIPEYRGHGLGRWLVETVLDHPSFARVRRWLLASRSARGLYAKLDFEPLPHPEWFMERWNPAGYGLSTPSA